MSGVWRSRDCQGCREFKGCGGMKVLAISARVQGCQGSGVSGV